MASSLHSFRLDHRHWRLLDGIAQAPNGEIRQHKLQEYFGTEAMMQVLEDLYENGFIENVHHVHKPGMPPQRIKDLFRLTLEAQRLYDKSANNRPPAPPVHPTPLTEADERDPRGRPPGARNKPKDQLAPQG